MKTTFFTTVLLIFALTSAMAKTENVANAETNLGSYKVSASSKSNVVENKSEGKYTINYSKLNSDVSIDVVEKKNCKVFLVRTDGYEVQYSCNGKYFGVQYMSNEYATYPKAEMTRKINRKAFLNQRIITRQIPSEQEMVRLIACFLPELMR